ncbi:MAG: sce7726 family protein [Chitinophagaceae bacterium]
MHQKLEKDQQNDSMICSLARSYHALHSYYQLQQIIRPFYPNKVNDLSKTELHRLINNFLLKYYKGETTLKAKLTELFINAQVTAAFEIKVCRSRADFLAINGDSKSFEIKSELDNLTKLAKQVSDYEKVFDYNYIVVDQVHYKRALTIIPDHYGIYILENMHLIELRKGERNVLHDISRQLDLFTKKEFESFFRIPGTTKAEVLANFTDAEINERFKDMLKRRYAKRWNFLVKNSPKIHPIDYQFFFQHNISPDVIYQVA